MKYIIREMNEKDWNKVAYIYKQGIETNKATFETEVPSYEIWNKSHIKICRYVLIIEAEVVGWVALSKVSSRLAYKGVAEISIYIDNNYKGKNIGYNLLNHLIQEAFQQEIWTLQATIFEDNIKSLSLHKKCGFREVGYREKIGRDKLGNWQNTVLMELRNKNI